MRKWERERERERKWKREREILPIAMCLKHERVCEEERSKAKGKG